MRTATLILTEHDAEVIRTFIDATVRVAGIQVVESAAGLLAKVNGLEFVESEPEKTD